MLVLIDYLLLSVIFLRFVNLLPLESKLTKLKRSFSPSKSSKTSNVFFKLSSLYPDIEPEVSSTQTKSMLGREDYYCFTGSSISIFLPTSSASSAVLTETMIGIV